MGLRGSKEVLKVLRTICFVWYLANLCLKMEKRVHEQMTHYQCSKVPFNIDRYIRHFNHKSGVGDV